jgi:membrane-associated phospholipid phosphatase
MAVIKGLDAAGNACPSLHVASAVFSAFWFGRLFRIIGVPSWLSRFSILYCLAILWSTLATRQHVMLDVLAGAVVGSIFAVLSLRHARRVAGDDF